MASVSPAARLNDSTSTEKPAPAISAVTTNTASGSSGSLRNTKDSVNPASASATPKSNEPAENAADDNTGPDERTAGSSSSAVSRSLTAAAASGPAISNETMTLPSSILVMVISAGSIPSSAANSAIKSAKKSSFATSSCKSNSTSNVKVTALTSS